MNELHDRLDDLGRAGTEGVRVWPDPTSAPAGRAARSGCRSARWPQWSPSSSGSSCGRPVAATEETRS